MRGERRQPLAVACADLFGHFYLEGLLQHDALMNFLQAFVDASNLEARFDVQ